MMNIIASLLLVAASFRVGVAELLEYKKLLKGVTSREPKQFHRKLTSVTYPLEAPKSDSTSYEVNADEKVHTEKREAEVGILIAKL